MSEVVEELLIEAVAILFLCSLPVAYGLYVYFRDKEHNEAMREIEQLLKEKEQRDSLGTPPKQSS